MRKVYLLATEELKVSGRAEALRDRVDPGRRAKILRLKREEDRLRSLGAGLLLQYAVGKWTAGEQEDGPCSWLRIGAEEFDSMPYFDLRYRYGHDGKPYLEGIPLFFSISHSGGLAACGISEREIGVDLQEKKNLNMEALAGRYFDVREKELFGKCREAHHREELFYRLWTQKEAFGKLTGRGLLEGLAISPELDADKLGIRFCSCPGLAGYAATACWYD